MEAFMGTLIEFYFQQRFIRSRLIRWNYSSGAKCKNRL